MTEAADDRRIQATASASQTVFTYDFKIRAATEIRIEKRAVSDDAVTLLVEGGGNDYTLTGVGDAGGGTFVLTSGATEDDIYTAQGLTALAKETNYADDLDPDTLNGDFDEIYRIVNELQRDIARSIRMPQSDSDGVVLGSDMVLGLSVDRASKFLKFDGDGKVALVASASVLVGPASSTDNAIPRFDGASGALLQNSGVVISDTDQLIAVAGTAGAPSITGAGDLDTGIYFPAGNQVAIAGAGARQVNITGVATAVNYIDFRGAVAGGDPAITMLGSDDDVGLTLTLKGAGDFNIAGAMHLTHVATATDDHAFEIDVNAAGFGDVKALDIAYETGALAAGSDEAVILVNIDESASTGGDVSAFEVLGTDFGSAGLYGLKTGVNVSPVRQLSGSFGDADTILVKAVDQATALSGGGGGNITIFVADNDTITIGDAAKFEELEFDIDTPASGGGVAPAFEYSTGSGTWASFVPVDGTNGFRNTGVVLWDDADIPAWAVGVGTDFLIRITRTRNSLTTTPILDMIQITAATEYSWSAAGVINIARLTVANGTAGAPSISFPADPDTGAYRAGANLLGLAAFGALQVQIGGIENAVNFWELSGNIATGAPRLKVLGSDTNVNAFMTTKGSGGWFFTHQNSDNVRSLQLLADSTAVNHIGITGKNTGIAPIIAALGSDTDIDLDLVTKGTGVVTFGAHTTLGGETISGYITIKDAGGTTRLIGVVS